MKHSIRSIRALLYLLAAMIPAVATGQITGTLLNRNGSFESGLEHWTAAGNQSVQTSLPYVASDGSRLIAFNGGNSVPNGSLSQTFATTPGISYTIEYDVGVLAYNTSQQRLQLTASGSGVLLHQVTLVNGSGNGTCRWFPQKFVFTANSTLTQILFQDQSQVTNSVDLLLDHVRVVRADQASGPPAAKPDAYQTSTNSTLRIPAAGVLFNDTNHSARIMPLGDSITRGSHSTLGDIPGGYRSKLAALLQGAALDFDFVGGQSDNSLSGLDPDHQGINGIRTDQVLTSLSSTLAYNPDIVMVHLGTNDILQNIPVSTAAGNLSTLIDQLTSPNSPNRRVFVATLIPIVQSAYGRSASQLNADVDAYNIKVRSMVEQYASQGRRVVLVDMNARLIYHTGNQAEDFFQAGDGIHPAKPGYDRMAELWHSVLSGYAPIGFLSARVLKWPASGSLNLAANGGFTYSPASGFTGTDTFTYVANDGISDSNPATVSIQVSSTVTPLYHQLTVSSIPVGNVGINVTPADFYGNANGNSTFTRTYVDGSNVELTAPEWVGNYQFVKWQSNGSDLTFSKSARVTLNQQVAATAVYALASSTAEKLANGSFESSLTSWNASGNVTTTSTSPYQATDGSKLAVFNGGNSIPGGRLSQTFATLPGTTYRLTFDMGVLSYNTQTQKLQVAASGTTQILSAQIDLAGPGGGKTRWSPQSFTFIANSSSTTLAFTDLSSTTEGIDLLLDHVSVHISNQVVHSLTVTSVNATGVGVWVSPSDLSGAGYGLTNFTRNYLSGTVVKLSAPTSIGSGKFLGWQRNGTDFSQNPVISITMDANVSFAAVYHFPTTTLLANGSFESGLAGWESGGNVVAYSQTPYSASHGANLLVFNGGDTAPSGRITQKLTTIPGATYTLEFDLGVLSYSTLQQKIQVILDGSGNLLNRTFTISRSSGSNMLWVPQSLDFVANSTTTILAFSDVSTVTHSLDLTLDHVRIFQTNPTAGPSAAAPSQDWTMAESASLEGKPGEMKISMNVSDSGLYFLEWSEDLDAWYFHSVRQIDTPGLLEFTDEESGFITRFYRIGYSIK